jgi:hypothetical protein
MAFFASLLALLALSVLFVTTLPKLFDNSAFINSFYFLMGGAVGASLAGFLIQGRFSVFLHELKHSILSGLVGNKARAMKVKKNSGYFKYEYTAETEAYNAFIALAPYFFPLFTIPAAISALVLWGANHMLPSIVLIGGAFGADLLLNIKDIGPHQSDISLIKGGYTVGIFYIFVANLSISLIILAWVFQGDYGLKFLLHALWDQAINIVAYYRSS